MSSQMYSIRFTFFSQTQKDFIYYRLQTDLWERTSYFNFAKFKTQKTN